MVMNSRAASILLGSLASQVMVESPFAVFAREDFGAMMNLLPSLQQCQFGTRDKPKMN